MRKILTAILAGLLAVSLTSTGVDAAPQRVDLPPDLVEALANAERNDLIDVVVTFKTKANLSAERAAKRQERRKKVIEKLKDVAEVSQAGAVAELAGAAGDEVTEVTPLWVTNAIAITAKPRVINRLAKRRDIESIVLDEIDIVPTYGTPEPNIAAINAPAAWDAGNTGQGVVVANLDTGVDDGHPALAASYRGGSNSWFDPYGQNANPTDLTGHGTGTMSVIVGNDAGGTSMGVAPGAQWIAAKIYDNSGSATISAIHQAFQWVLDPDGNPNTDDGADVVNNSWAIGTPGCSLEFQSDLQALRAAGVVPVFAAGNYGPSAGTSPSPANNPEALAVGAVDGSNNIYGSSSRGPSACGESSTVYPELVAPGIGIRVAERFGLYGVDTGTSVAAPHATGTLALLLSAYPSLTDTEQIDALVDTAADLGTAGPDDTFGHGLLDVDAALQSLVPPALFADGFESGDTSAWPTTVNFKNRLSVTSAAALDGSSGMQIEILNGRDLYVADTSPSAATSYTGSFRFDPNSVALPNRKVQDLLVALDGSNKMAIRVRLRLSSGVYQLKVLARDDAGKNKSRPWVAITDDPHLIEVDWNAATTPGGNDGQWTLSVDGSQVASKGGIVNSTIALEEIRLGAPKALHKNTRGTEYFDDYTVVAMS